MTLRGLILNVSNLSRTSSYVMKEARFICVKLTLETSPVITLRVSYDSTYWDAAYEI